MKIAFALLGSALLLTGCVTTSSGPEISHDKVDQIKKGVTTRAEVESLLGPPMHVAMLPEGRRMLLYSFNRSKEKSGNAFLNASRFIPVIGPGTMIASGAAIGAGASNAGTTLQRQTLQVAISKDGIVEDFEFSDKTTDVSAGLFNGSATTTDTPRN